MPSNQRAPGHSAHGYDAAKGKKVVAIQVRLPEELDEALAEEATRKGVTKSDIIRAWISALPKAKPKR
jgi:Ribbon-helix-helix protein, copG family